MLLKNLSEKLKNATQVVDSHLDTHYRIGMRVVKTGAAVMVCLLIALLTGDMDSIPISAVSAIVTIRPTQGETLHTGTFRVLGTIIGGILGVLTALIGLYVPYYDDGLFIVVIPLMLLLDLYICNVLKMQDSCTISCVVIVLVAAPITPSATISGAMLYTILRVRDTIFGAVIGTALNIVPYRIAGLLKNKQDEPAQEDKQ